MFDLLVIIAAVVFRLWCLNSGVQARRVLFYIRVRALQVCYYYQWLYGRLTLAFRRLFKVKDFRQEPIVLRSVLAKTAIHTCDTMSKGAKSQTYRTNLFVTYYDDVLGPIFVCGVQTEVLKST